MAKRNREEWRARMRLQPIHQDRHGKWVAIELTQGQEAIVDADDLEKVLDFGIWCVAEDMPGRYYVVTSKRQSDGRWKQFKLHRLILDCWNPEIFGDHIDGNGLNNRKHNLRLATKAQNSQHRRKQTQGPSSSPYKGVFFDRRRPSNPWIARIYVDGKSIYLKSYKTAEEAAIVYDIAALEHHGEFAVPNFKWRKLDSDEWALIN